jgi:hypothetical protein
MMGLGVVMGYVVNGFDGKGSGVALDVGSYTILNVTSWLSPAGWERAVVYGTR